MMHFYKYHGLGNDYIVLDPADAGNDLSPERIRMICHRNYGIGSDGILLGPMAANDAAFGLRIFNPDGSEAEKSGNGLRIFARYLHDRRRVSADSPFIMATMGGDVTAKVMENGRMVSVEIGRVNFNSTKIPVTGPGREVLNETLTVDGEQIPFCAAGIGNPHCVIIKNAISPEETRRLGPAIERHPLFPNRINVQFMKIIDRANIAIEIWERGAGYTLASGSSSSAAAAVAHRLGLCDPHITVHMPGGTLDITIDSDYGITLIGPVIRVAKGELDNELFSQSFDIKSSSI